MNARQASNSGDSTGEIVPPVSGSSTSSSYWHIVTQGLAQLGQQVLLGGSR